MNNEEMNVQEEAASAKEQFSFGAWWAKLAVAAKAGIIAVAALVVIVPIVLVFALGGNDDNNNNPGGNPGGGDEISYSITVKDNEGAPIEDVKVSFILKNGTPLKATTDENGKATPSVKAEFTSVKITSVPTGYEYDKLNTALTFDNSGSVSVTMNKLPYYIVKILDQNDNAVAGVVVQMCSDTYGCFSFADPTDANGETKNHIYTPSNDYQAKILDLPEGYEGDTETYHDFDADNTVIIRVTKIA